MYVYFVEIIPFTFTFVSASQQRAYTKIHLMSTLVILHLKSPFELILEK